MMGFHSPETPKNETLHFLLYLVNIILATLLYSQKGMNKEANCHVDFVAEELTTMEPKGGLSIIPVKLSDRF
jgi:hypothetical protein